MSSSEEDTRIPCKYGANCYQKNPAHHTKFKHPEKRPRSVSPETKENLKKQKAGNEQGKSPRTEEKTEDEETNESEERNENEPAEDAPDEEEWVNDVKLLESFEERKDFIKDHFLVDMPDDFYSFWDLCKELNKEKPKEAFKSVGLTLVGPYDILDESLQTINTASTHKYFLHWRYYYDPPEFQTIIAGDEKTGYHIGYFRDSPDEKPTFVGYNEANKDCTIIQMGDNIFGAINTYLEKFLRRADPFKKLSLTKLQKAVANKAKELKFNLNNHGRSRKTVCKSFHTAGISVPYNRSTQIGYRPLPVTEKELKKMLGQVVTAYESNNEKKAFSSIQSIITAATIANDECDFGTALEFGIDLFSYGHDCFNTIILNILKVTYALLNRHVFAEIIEEHLKCRKKQNPCLIQLNN